MKSFLAFWIAGWVLALAGPAFAATAGEIIIVGSDVVSNHGDQFAFSTALFNDLAEFSTKPILVLNDFGGGGPGYVGGTGFDFESSISGLNLSDYSAIWFASPSRCCGDFSTELSQSDANAILNFRLAGGAIGIENFLGGGACSVNGTNPAVWTTIFQFDPTPGLIGVGCADAIDPINAIASAEGVLDGFPAFASENCCWSHQVYDPGFWAAHDSTLIMSAGDPSLGQWNVLEGNTPEPTPEPSSLLLVCTGIAGLAGAVRHKLLR